MALGSRRKLECRRKKLSPVLCAGSGDVRAARVLVEHRFKPRLQSCLRLYQGNVLLQTAEDLHPTRAAIEHRLESGNGLGGHDGWNPEGRNLADVDAMECRCSDPDNCHGMLVHKQLP